MTNFILALIIVVLHTGCNKKEVEKDPPNGAKGTDDAQTDPYETLKLDGLKYKYAYYEVRKDNEREKNHCFLIPKAYYTADALSECEKKSALGQKLQKWGFCTESETMDILNELPCDVAKEAAVFLNNNIKFTAEGPYPDSEDNEIVCKTDPTCKDKKELQDYCDFHYHRCAGQEACADIGRLDSETEKAIVAECLNKAYGIK